MGVKLGEWLRHHPQPIMGTLKIKEESQGKGELNPEDWEIVAVQNLKEWGREFTQSLLDQYVTEQDAAFALNDPERKDEPEGTINLMMSATLAGQIITTLQYLLGETINVVPASRDGGRPSDHPAGAGAEGGGEAPGEGA